MSDTNKVNRAKILLGIALLSIVAVAPLTMSVYAQSTTTYEVENSPMPRVDDTNADVTGVEPENGEPSVSSSEPESLEPTITQSDLQFSGNTKGWIIVDKVAYPSSVELQGTSFSIGNGMWQLDADGRFEIVDRFADLTLTGFVVDDIIVLHGKGVIDDGKEVSVFLRGFFAPTTESGKFVMAFTHAGLNNDDNRYPLIQSGTMTVTIPTAQIEPVDPTGIYGPDGTDGPQLGDLPQAEDKSNEN